MFYLIPQLSCFHVGCINHKIRSVSQDFEPFSFSLESCCYGTSLGKRMTSPRLVVTSEKHSVRSLQIKNFVIYIILSQLIERILQIVKQLAASYIYHKCRLIYPLAVSGQVDKAFYQSRRHIVDAVISHILQTVDSLGFPGAGKAGDYYRFHCISSIFTILSRSRPALTALSMPSRKSPTRPGV